MKPLWDERSTDFNRQRGLDAVIVKLLSLAMHLGEEHLFDMPAPAAYAIELIDFPKKFDWKKVRRAIRVLSLLDPKLPLKERGWINRKYSKKIARASARHWRRVSELDEKWFKNQNKMRKEWKKKGWD